MVKERACNSCGVIKSLNEFYNARNGMFGKMSECILCNKAKRQIYRQNNREKERIRGKRYGAANKEKVRDRVRQWRKNNPGKARALRRMREAKELQACPPWARKGAVKKKILAHYLHAEWLELTTKEKMHVDHIVPLRNDFVCGLHVPSNLMVLVSGDNISKSAYWWPEQLPCQRGRGASHEWWNELYEQMVRNDTQG